MRNEVELTAGEIERFRCLDKVIRETGRTLGDAWVERNEFAQRLIMRYGEKPLFRVDGVPYGVTRRGKDYWFMMDRSARKGLPKRITKRVRVQGSKLLSYTCVTIELPELPEQLFVPTKIMTTPQKHRDDPYAALDQAVRDYERER